LVEDLVIAEGTTLVRPDAGERTRNRIVVTTETPASPELNYDDEQTLVRSRTVPGAPAAMRQQSAPPAAGFNPWRIVIPSLAGLLVVFAVIYAFTRTTQPSTNPNSLGQPSGLSADPNSQPVQPASPPRGNSEQGIPLGGAVSPNANANTAANVNASLSPTPAANENANTDNTNDNKSVNANNRAPELPSPRHSPEASPKPTNPSLPSPTTPTVKPTGTPPPLD
jgi:hypothetical protein